MTVKVKVSKTEDKNAYEVLIGKGLINRVGEIIRENLSDKISENGFVIISGPNSARYYLTSVENSLKKAGYHNFKSITVGEEKIKSISNMTPIILGGNRFHPILQTFKGYIYIPTTLLGMSNNAVMGDPIISIADINILNTLEYKYFMSGYSEIAKHAIMSDPEFFEWLEAHGRSIFDGDENARLYAIKKSCQIKAKFMANTDTKKLLGFGHLYGDSIRKIAKTNLLHGEVISLGIVAAFKLAHKMHICDVEDYKRARRHLKSMSLPVELYADYWNEEKIVKAISKDDPVILPNKIGQVSECKKELFHKTLIRVANEIISHQ
jgi:3-dehydroquinate synthase